MQSQIARYAAEKGVSRGTKGNFNSFNLVKDFGFNLVDYKNASRARALNTLSTVFNMTPRVNPMSPMSMMVDPNTAIGVAGQNNRTLFESQQANNNAVAAAGNYNRMQTAGVIANAASLFGTAYQTAGLGIQSKVGSQVDLGDTSRGSGLSPAPAQFGGGK